MKKLFITGALACSSLLCISGQEGPPSAGSSPIQRENLIIRPNSRDYTIIRKGNNHQRILQFRTHVLNRNRQAFLNRKMAMERRRTIIRQRMIRQQQIRQRMVHQRGMHR